LCSSALTAHGFAAAAAGVAVILVVLIRIGPKEMDMDASLFPEGVRPSEKSG
jgi:hypothetical protein